MIKATDASTSAAADIAAIVDEVRQAPNEELSRAKYRHHAGGYDHYSVAATPLRQIAISTLAPLPGEVVLDVGCGTGLNFAAIETGIGPGGRLVGVDTCPEMLAKAQERVERHGWQNVSLVEGHVERTTLPKGIDAVVISMVHDVMRSPGALRHVLEHLRPGGRVVTAGAKFVSGSLWWRWLLDPLVLEVNKPYVTSFEGFQEPWSVLAELLPTLTVNVDPWDVTYVAWGAKSHFAQPARLPARAEEEGSPPRVSTSSAGSAAAA
jgi:ubiquinone/menaquinone biosynthesis C-methylase UbiE